MLGDVVVVQREVQARDAVANGADGAQVVADENDRQAELNFQLRDRFEELLLAGGRYAALVSRDTEEVLQ